MMSPGKVFRLAARLFTALVLAAVGLWAAAFGRVVTLQGGASDIVLDERRGQVYLVSSLQDRVHVYSTRQQVFRTSVATGQTPLSAALSRDGRSLYVACFEGWRLDVIDLDALVVTARVDLPAKPEAVAVASDGRVLISTTGSGAAGASNVLLLYNPIPSAPVTLAAVPVALPAPTPPTFPPPSGRPFLAGRSQLVATRDGALIAGVNTPATGAPTLFVYEAASGTVPRARVVAGSSIVLSISDDGSRIMCGPNLFDGATLQVLAQQNVANAPYPIDPAASFNLLSNQGGSVFAPGGQTLYSVFDIAPVQGPANASQLMLSDPDNLLIRMGIQLPENLSGKMVISADGTNIHALSDSGFITVPVGTISQSPLAAPSFEAALLVKDACGVIAQTSSVLGINNAGRGSLSASVQLLRYSGQTNQPNPATAPAVRVLRPSGAPQFSFEFNPTVRTAGTVVPPHDFLIQSPEAINIPNRVRVYQNYRDPEARGTIIPIPGAAVREPFPDLIYDQTRQRLYIANTGLNRVEVYDIRSEKLLAPIKVGQLPRSMALTPDGGTLYVANSGGETISIVDPDQMQTTGRVRFPPLPFNSNLALATPSVIAAGLSGLQILTSDGTLWTLVGDMAVPRGVSRILGQTAQGLPIRVPMPSSMAATPGGEYILLATGTGMAYLYDATIDDYLSSRQVYAASQTGYIGPVAAGPGGQYFVMNGTVLNQQLAPLARASGLVSAVAVGSAVGALFSPPASGTALPAVQVLDTRTGAARGQVSALEGPIITPGTGRLLISGRTMAVDSAGTTAYVITASGLSILPLSSPPASAAPRPSQGGAVNSASYLRPVAANGLLSIFGQNLGDTDVAWATPLPLVLGGTCVTLGGTALPLFYMSPTQINAQIPPNLAAGTYPLIVRSVANHAASSSQQVAVARYAPAVLVDSSGQIALVHADGRFVSKQDPATRDEPLTMYALGLGPTTGGAVVAGEASPSNPLAVTGEVEVFFGDTRWAQSPVIVDWSGLAPGYVGLYQLNLRIPGFHMNGEALPVTIRVGGVTSPATGPAVPYVAVN